VPNNTGIKTALSLKQFKLKCQSNVGQKILTFLRKELIETVADDRENTVY